MASIFKPIIVANVPFAIISSAAPANVNKQGEVVVWKTVTTVIWTTVHVTTTVYTTMTATESQSSPTIIPTPSGASVILAPSKKTIASKNPESITPATTIQVLSSSISSSGYSGSCSKNSPCVGQATYYDTATSADAPSSCNTTNDGFTENVLALSREIMTNTDCGKTVTVTYNGVTTSGTVVDECMGCDNTLICLGTSLLS